jgi:hypothetical protein
MDVTTECPCPGTPHEQDIITLRPHLDYRAAAAIKYAVALYQNEHPEMDVADIMALLSERYIRSGVMAWTLVDETGKPVTVSDTAIVERLLVRTDIASEVGDACDELYAEAVMRPLLRLASQSSRPSPTNGSTSPTNGHGRKSPKRSRHSSITTIPTVATATTSGSPDGDSRSSRSSESAAG